MKNLKKDKLDIRIDDPRKEMGTAAAADIETAVCEILKTKDCCNMIFAAAPSQNEVLEALAASEKIDWSRVNAYHMDEYIGLAQDAPQGFANFLRRGLFDKVPFASVNCLDSTNEPNAECERYGALLSANPTDIVCMGIGENGHIAFNDPHVADFHDTHKVKIVDLDETCRMQQVHDGCFESLDQVPKQALTLAIPTLTAPKYVFCVVPASTKATAVERTINDPVSENCPASILRHHDRAVLYLDKDSAAKLEE